MSDATLQALHDAIAAHLADENEDGDTRYLTEWVIVTASAMGEPGMTAYFYTDSELPYHHAIGLLDWGLTFVKDEGRADQDN